MSRRPSPRLFAIAGKTVDPGRKLVLAARGGGGARQHMAPGIVIDRLLREAIVYGKRGEADEGTRPVAFLVVLILQIVPVHVARAEERIGQRLAFDLF